jgi:hypothetical protein
MQEGNEGTSSFGPVTTLPIHRRFNIRQIMATRTGGCRCEGVRYEVTGDPIMVINCYCGICRKLTGGPYFSGASFPSSSFKLLEGSQQKSFKSSEKVVRYFCGRCSSTVYDTLDTGKFILSTISLGTLDEADHGLKPTVNMMVKYKPSYLDVMPGLQNYDELPPL